MCYELRMRYDADHKARTRLRLLTEAAILLRENGPDGLSVATLMSRQGRTHGGFYAHFESKDDLIEHAVGTMFDKTCDRFATQTRGLAPVDGLLAYIDYYLSPTHINRPGQGCPIPACGGDVARLGAEARRRFEDGVRRLQDLIAVQLEMAGVESMRAQAAAVALLTQLAGGVVMARAVKSSDMQAHIAEMARSNVLMALDAILQRTSPQSADRHLRQ